MKITIVYDNMPPLRKGLWPDWGASLHLKGALSVPLNDLERKLSELPRDREVVAYCRGPYCVLAVKAVEMLRIHGFKASRLEYGIPDWQAKGFPVVVNPYHS